MRLIKFDFKQKPAKIFLFALLISLVVLLLIYSLLKKPQTPSTSTTKTITPSPSPSSLTPQTQVAPKSYFINSINTKIPVTGYSWQGEQLIYSTPEGIYQAGTNTQLLKAPLNYISWSQNGKAIYQSNNQWYLFSPDGQKSVPTSISGTSPLISPNSEYITSFNNTTVVVKSLLDSSETNLETGKVDALAWSSQKNLLAVSKKESDHTAIRIFDAQANLLKFIQSPTETALLAFSPQASKILTFQKGNTSIIDLSSEQRINIELNQNSTATALFLDEQQLILIETTPDRVGRYIDYLWKIDTSGTKEFLTNTMPIPRKINRNTTFFPNPVLSALPLIEKQNSIWLVSLVPNLLPSYSPEKGLIFSPVSTKGD